MEMTASSATCTTVVSACLTSLSCHRDDAGHIEDTHGVSSCSITTTISRYTIKISSGETPYRSFANTRGTGSAIAATCTDAGTGTTATVTTGTTVTRVDPIAVAIIS